MSWIDLWICSTLQKCLFFSISYHGIGGFPYGSSVKNLPATQELQEMWVQSLDWEDPLEESLATHSSILAWRIPWTEKHSGLQSMGTQRVRNDWSILAHRPIMALLIICFIFTKRWWHFRLVANMVLGQLKDNGHELLRACLYLPHSIST